MNSLTRKSSPIAYFLIFLAFLMSMRCWIGFEGRAYLYQFVFFIAMSLMTVSGQVKVVFKKRYIIFAAIAYFFLMFNIKTSQNLNGYIEKLIPVLNLLYIISLVDEEKDALLAYVTKWWGFIMLLGVPIYVLSLFVSLPSFGTIMADYGSANITAGLYKNYIFCILPLDTITSFPRFSGPFVEPGDLGCVGAFILMACQFNFKKYKNLIFVLLGVLVSLSLAGIMLTGAGYLFYLLYNNRVSPRNVFFVILVIYGIYAFGTFYNGGDNFINETILSRLQADEDTGFTGNNRTSLLKMEYFFMMFSDPNTMLFGYDQQTLDMLYEKGLGAGFINQAIVVGMVGMLGLFLPYLYITVTSSAKRYAWLFFLFFALYMFQRTDSLWMSFVMCYVYGIVIMENDNEKLI